MNDQYETTIQFNDFEGARPGSPCKCVVAKALQRTTGLTVAIGCCPRGRTYPFIWVGPEANMFEFTVGGDIVGRFDRGERNQLTGLSVRIKRLASPA